MNLTVRRSIRSHVLLTLFSLVMIYPVLWWVGAAFKSNDEMSSPSLFPTHWLWSNFTEGWTAIPKYTFTHFYMNTFELIAGVLITSVLSCSLVAFGFARLDFPLKNFWFSILMVTLMLPTQVTLVPQYIMFNAWGWVNTYLPFYVPHALAGGIGGPFFIFLLVQFIRGLPKDLDESAKMDGCSWFGIYWRIILPLTKPALVTVMIYCFLWNWDDFFGHLLYINSVDKYTVGLALKLFVDSQSALPWGQLLAMSLVSVVPSLILFFMAQKHFVDGIASGAVKG
ncbi:carbohydrate ABC transporter permease [Paenibacillus doosanensis]|uniref:L-arabinose transport system permease protein AraQ n=1 Tax=Paenibacillus konkukensis TaxID=2020716 RepID=A0ABY4RY94_9BACL|nr:MULTISPECIES: carbohydrate ABC transporter permease [Paenibacillus]MCS7459015.1 carbohydrate ABC transporter permease [Paenibacillus doosanensis]UQZ86392.1 L-arabinose transport system permease protein AraQ [Paenibacillus konkukensis]